MILETGKTYIARDGRKVRVICTDKLGDEFVIVGLVESKHDNGETAMTWTKSGTFFDSGEKHGLDLMSEYSFWNDVKVDTKILVKSFESGEWKNRYFAKYEDGKVYAHDFGNTSWSNDIRRYLSWEYAKLYDKKDEL